MKRLLFVVALITVAGLSTIVNAALHDNGGGLLYDTVLDITWYDSTYSGRSNEGATHRQAINWASELSAGGTTGWTLPTVSQMLELYSTGLNLNPPVGVSSSNQGPFTSVRPVGYWSLADPYLGGVWWVVDLNNENWFQSSGSLHDLACAMGVHTGNVGASVPEPSTVVLLGLGLVGLAGLRGKFKTQGILQSSDCAADG